MRRLEYTTFELELSLKFGNPVKHFVWWPIYEGIRKTHCVCRLLVFEGEEPQSSLEEARVARLYSWLSSLLVLPAWVCARVQDWTQIFVSLLSSVSLIMNDSTCLQDTMQRSPVKAPHPSIIRPKLGSARSSGVDEASNIFGNRSLVPCPPIHVTQNNLVKWFLSFDQQNKLIEM